MDHSAFAQVLVANLSQFVPRNDPVKIGLLLFFPASVVRALLVASPKAQTALWVVVCRSSGFRVNQPTKNTLLTDLFMSSHPLSISAILHIL
jgi:hypothetical protein